MCRHIQSGTSSAAIVPTDREVLPTNVKPLHYDLTLEPFFDTFTFDGEETIEFQVNERTNYITLNIFEIKIHEVKIGNVKVDDITYDSKQQTVTFKFNDHLEQGATANLYIKFTGELNDKMAGFYRAAYEEDGKTKYLATTLLEPIDCRRVFPCYDEPAAKAKFTVALIADKDLVCLSNQPEKETTLVGSNKKKVSFTTTPLMSTYLLALIVGDLRYVENNDYRVPIKVYSIPGSEHLGVYSGNIAAKTLEFFDKKFDIPYPYDKLDLVSVPEFAVGAIESSACIIFRSVDLLLDEKNTNANTKQRVTEVVIHELAHQWFGDLVTMDFWDGLWLNEGFATWMSWYACDALYPDWKVWESYVSDSLQHALNLDALRSSHPIEVPVKRADEINQIFDAISYSKGSSLLKMISKWLGEDVFIKGVSNYLKKHKWGNTQTSDLWDSLSEASGKDVVKVMDIWTKNTGFPVVHVKELGNGEIEVTQNRFLATADVKEDENKVLYPVFLGLKTSEGVDESLILDTRSKTVKIPTSDDFFKVNADQTGIYRTAYEPSRWTKLGKAGVEGKLSVEDRVGLVADAGSLSSSGFIETSSLLDLVKSWSKETNYVVWGEILTRIGSIKAALMFEDEATKNALKVFTRDLIGEKLNEIGWKFTDNDSFADQQLKSSLYASAANADDPKAVDFAKEAFAKFVAGDKKAINPNLRPSIFNTVAKFGDEKTFDELYNIYINPQSIEEKIAALRAFGRFTKPEILDKVTGLLLKNDIIKPQDIYIPLQGMRAHKLGVEKLWSWLSENWDAIYKNFPPGLSMLGSIVTLSTSGFTKEDQKKKVEDFFANKDTKGYDQSVAQSLDIITTKIRWSDRDSKSIFKWLEVNGYTK
ncbi:APE2 Aminopeptidase 2 [Candida maltosa Xu316]